jgi:hypothetical protein
VHQSPLNVGGGANFGDWNMFGIGPVELAFLGVLLVCAFVAFVFKRRGD